MSEENAYNIPDDVAAEVDSTDLVTRPPNPLYEGTVRAIFKSVKPYKHKDKVSGEETGAVSYILGFAIQDPIKEYLVAGEASGLTPREFNIGHRIETWLGMKLDPLLQGETREFRERMDCQARSEFGIATGVTKYGEPLDSARIKAALEKPLVLKLTVNKGNQRVRYKALTTNGKA